MELEQWGARNDNDTFASLWSPTNQTGSNMKLTLNCSDIDNFNDYLIFKDDCIKASFNYWQKFHDK